MIYDKRIAYDVDGCIIHFWKAFCKEAGHKHIINCESWDEYVETPWFKITWRNIKHDKDFWSTLPILNMPGDIKTPVTCYITSCPSEMYEARIYNLFKLHKFPPAPLEISNNKLIECEEYTIDFLIDDKHSTVVEVNEAYERAETGTRALKYIPYYMDEEVTPWDLHDLSKVKEKLNELGWDK